MVRVIAWSESSHGPSHRMVQVTAWSESLHGPSHRMVGRFTTTNVRSCEGLQRNRFRTMQQNACRLSETEEHVPASQARTRLSGSAFQDAAEQPRPPEPPLPRRAHISCVPLASVETDALKLGSRPESLCECRPDTRARRAHNHHRLTAKAVGIKAAPPARRRPGPDPLRAEPFPPLFPAFARRPHPSRIRDPAYPSLRDIAVPRGLEVGAGAVCRTTRRR